MKKLGFILLVTGLIAFCSNTVGAKSPQTQSMSQFGSMWYGWFSYDVGAEVVRVNVTIDDATGVTDISIIGNQFYSVSSYTGSGAVYHGAEIDLVVNNLVIDYTANGSPGSISYSGELQHEY